MKFYTAIKNAAEDYGISIHKLEQKTGITQGTIRTWDHYSPRIDALLKVQEFLGVDLIEQVRDAEEVANETADDR